MNAVEWMVRQPSITVRRPAGAKESTKDHYCDIVMKVLRKRRIPMSRQSIAKHSGLTVGQVVIGVNHAKAQRMVTVGQRRYYGKFKTAPLVELT